MINLGVFRNYQYVGFRLIFLLSLYDATAQPLEEKVNQYLKPLVESGDFYGTVLFARNGKVELAKGYGYADLEHEVPNTVHSVYHMGSLNKPLTAIGVMILHQRKLLDIDSPISTYLKDYPMGDEITVKHLLAQTSGIPSYNQFADYEVYANRDNSLAEVVDWFKNEKLLFEPGTKYGYSNSNYVLLALIMETISGLDYKEFMRSNLFQPLEMRNTGIFKFDEIVKNRAIGYDPANNLFALKPVGYYNNSIKIGSGAVHSTVLDMLKLEEALYTNKILDEPARKLMLTEVNDNDYGLGWGIWPRFSKRKYDHDGASPGSVAYFSTYPDDKVTIIFLGNINSGIFQGMKKDLAAIYFGEKYEIPQVRKYLALSPSQLSKYEGRYEFDNGNFFDLKLIKGELRFLWRGRGDLGYLLSPLSDSRFYMRARGDEMRFEMSGNSISKVIYVEQSEESLLKRINP